jgi:hypothetical protein
MLAGAANSAVAPDANRCFTCSKSPRHRARFAPVNRGPLDDIAETDRSVPLEASLSTAFRGIAANLEETNRASQTRASRALPRNRAGSVLGVLLNRRVRAWCPACALSVHGSVPSRCHSQACGEALSACGVGRLTMPLQLTRLGFLLAYASLIDFVGSPRN